MKRRLCPLLRLRMIVEDDLHIALMRIIKEAFHIREQFGIDISYIDNIVRMQRITRVPKTQKYFKGVINLRGEVIPVMSLRLKFDFDADEITNKTRILIIKPDSQASVGA